MGSQQAPKVVLFDIGGVVVLSPFQRILDFERKSGIPTGWINFAIRHSSPNGHWQRLERGEIKLDAQFLKGFTADLHNETAWHEFNSSFRSEKKKLKDYANPTLLGDHVSLKAEAADSRPTDQDRGSQSSDASSSSSSGSNTSESRDEEPRPTRSKLAEDRTIGDPVSLESEDVVKSGKDHSSQGSPLTREPIVSRRIASDNSGHPSLPKIDGEKLFWGMMSASREPDPYIFPALERLQEQNPRPILGALSNTVVFPSDHPWSKPSGSSSTKTGSGVFFFNPASFFDVYVASAEVRMRKPSKEIYELAVHRLDEYDRKHGGQGVKPEDVLFLDDIGENLKMAKEMGMGTIRVQLGKTWRAVKELENALGVELMDEKTRRAKL
ncbi:MAG: hypothetical protein Q9217_002071 [Psora testacea]